MLKCKYSTWTECSWTHCSALAGPAEMVAIFWQADARFWIFKNYFLIRHVCHASGVQGKLSGFWLKLNWILCHIHKMSVKSNLLTTCSSENLLKGRGKPCYFFSLLSEQEYKQMSQRLCKKCGTRWFLLFKSQLHLPGIWNMVKHWILLFTSKATCSLVPFGGTA